MLLKERIETKELYSAIAVRSMGILPVIVARNFIVTVSGMDILLRMPYMSRKSESTSFSSC
jgi:hypothetical protein